MKKVKQSDVITIEGVEYRIGRTAADAINILSHFSVEELKNSGSTVHLYRLDSKDGDLIPVWKIKAALETLEK